jgi:hypothetical protein
MQDNPTRIARAVRSRLSENASTLEAAIVLQNADQSVQQSLTDLLCATLEAQGRISQTRLQLAHESTSLHTLYAQVLTASIRLLEQTIHGSVSRATKAHADYLALVAEGMSKKLGLQHAQLMTQLYSPEMQAFLQERSEETLREERTARRKADEAEETLRQYRSNRAADAVAKEYAEIMAESERVRGEIERLQSRR